MTNTAQIYNPPKVTSAKALPAELARYLDGTELLAKTQALRLSTIDAGGWPHAALLSAGDVLALPSGRVRFVMAPRSATAANLIRDGRLTLTISLDRGMCELRLRAHKLEHSSPEVPLAFFEAEAEMTRVHTVSYADVTSGITFALHEPQAGLARWQRQIAALRAAT